ncbi:hypothetical protein E9993_08625 [Labilibacter sediminis]|nr:hypothetical protein E9993_08625 [Labilibacter sediminis]
MKRSKINKLSTLRIVTLAFMLSFILIHNAEGKKFKDDTKMISLTGYVMEDISPDSYNLYFVEVDGNKRLIAKNAFKQCETKYKHLKGRKVSLDVVLNKDKKNSQIQKVISANIISLPKITVQELKPKNFKGKKSKTIELEGLLFATMVNKNWNWMFDADDGNVYVLNWNASGIHEFTLPMYKYKRVIIKGTVISLNGKLFIDEIESFE